MFNINDEKTTLVAQGFTIPSKPECLSQIHDEQRHENPDLNRTAEIVASDVGLSANILKAINSPMFGLGRTVTDIQQSVMLLGLQNVINLVTFCEMRHHLSGEACIPLAQFWDTAVETARMMTATLNLLQLKRDCPIEDVYAFGLFHDCGIAVMAMRFNDYNETLIEADVSPEQDITAIEEQHYMTNHATLGYFVATSWNLPIPICALILRHHEAGLLDDDSVDDFLKDLYGLLAISENILNIYRSGEQDSKWGRIKGRIFLRFGISEMDYDDLVS